MSMSCTYGSSDMAVPVHAIRAAAGVVQSGRQNISSSARSIGSWIYNTKIMKSARSTVSYYCEKRPYCGRSIKDWGKVTAIYLKCMVRDALIGTAVGLGVGIVGTGCLGITPIGAPLIGGCGGVGGATGAFYAALYAAPNEVAKREKDGYIQPRMTYDEFEARLKSQRPRPIPTS